MTRTSDFESKKKENDQNFARNPFLRVKLHINRFKILKILKNQKNPEKILKILKILKNPEKVLKNPKNPEKS